MLNFAEANAHFSHVNVYTFRHFFFAYFSFFVSNFNTSIFFIHTLPLFCNQKRNLLIKISTWFAHISFALFKLIEKSLSIAETRNFWVHRLVESEMRAFKAFFSIFLTFLFLHSMLTHHIRFDLILHSKSDIVLAVIIMGIRCVRSSHEWKVENWTFSSVHVEKFLIMKISLTFANFTTFIDNILIIFHASNERFESENWKNC